MLSEEDTRVKLIDPKLHQNGWTERAIIREQLITRGKIVNESGDRLPSLKADYVLYFPNISTGVPIAVIEAEAEGKPDSAGMGQAKNYRDKLLVPFAYSTSGRRFEEYDEFSRLQRTLDAFPTPAELWKRYVEGRGLGQIVEEHKEEPLLFPSYPFPDKPMRYYQEVAIRNTIESLLKGSRRVLLTMATGSGKTYVAFQIIWKLYKSGKIKRVLYVVDRTFLKTQAFGAFEPFGNAREPIEEGKFSRAKEIYFATYQTLYSEKGGKRFYELFEKDFFDVVIIDECHRSGWIRWHDILRHFSSAVQLGMTATPKRTDNVDVYNYFSQPIYEYKMSEGIEDGFLAPCMDARRVFTNLDKAGGFVLTQIQSAGARIEAPQGVELKDYYSAEEFEREVLVPERNAVICDYLASFLESMGPKSKSIVFCVSQNHARDVAKELNNHFNPIFKIDNYSIPIIADEPSSHEILRTSFASSEKEFPTVATTVDLLSTGVDVPPIRNIVFLKPVSSKVEFHQIIGRATRVDEMSHKYSFKILDFTNATRLFDEWDLPELKGRRYEGPSDWYLSCKTVDYETSASISNASVVAITSPGNPLHVKTGENGLMLIKDMPRGTIKVNVSASGYRPKETILPTFPTPDRIVTIPLQRNVSERKQLASIVGINVYIEEENVVRIDVKGNKLLEAEYIRYSKDKIAEKAVTLGDLKKIWSNRNERRRFKEDLAKKGVDFDLLSKLIDASGVDEFDLVAYFLFDAPLVTRDERAVALLTFKKEIPEKFGALAREIIIELVDRYRLFGVDEITAAGIFETPPFDRVGYLRGVIDAFGGVGNLKHAIEEVEKGLYPDVFEVPSPA